MRAVSKTINQNFRLGGIFARILIALMASALLLTTAVAASKKTAELDEAMSHDGLQKTKVKGIDLVYVRPGATLASYKKVLLMPVEVSFHKDWDPQRTGSRMKLSTEERENIRSGISKIVGEEFAEELQKGNGYPVVMAPAADVLILRPSIINLYANAPDTMTAGRSRTYTVSAGEMTLVLEMFDSETRQVLARAIDRREASNTGMMTLSNSVVNSSEARALASSWARILRKRFDEANGVSK